MIRTLEHMAFNGMRNFASFSVVSDPEATNTTVQGELPAPGAPHPHRGRLPAGRGRGASRRHAERALRRDHPHAQRSVRGRVRQPGAQRRNAETSLRLNQYWPGSLVSYDTRGWDLIPNDAGLADRVTSATLQAAARRFVDAQNYVQVVLVPETARQ